MSQIEQLEAKRATVSRLVTTAKLSWCHKHRSAQICINIDPSRSHQHTQIHSNHKTHSAQPSSHPDHHFHLFFTKNNHKSQANHGDYLNHPPQAIKTQEKSSNKEEKVEPQGAVQKRRLNLGARSDSSVALSALHPRLLNICARE